MSKRCVAGSSRFCECPACEAAIHGVSSPPSTVKGNRKLGTNSDSPIDGKLGPPDPRDAALDLAEKALAMVQRYVFAPFTAEEDAHIQAALEAIRALPGRSK